MAVKIVRDVEVLERHAVTESPWSRARGQCACGVGVGLAQRRELDGEILVEVFERLIVVSIANGVVHASWRQGSHHACLPCS